MILSLYKEMVHKCFSTSKNSNTHMRIVDTSLLALTIKINSNNIFQKNIWRGVSMKWLWRHIGDNLEKIDILLKYKTILSFCSMSSSNHFSSFNILFVLPLLWRGLRFLLIRYWRSLLQRQPLTTLLHIGGSSKLRQWLKKNMISKFSEMAPCKPSKIMNLFLGI